MVVLRFIIYSCFNIRYLLPFVILAVKIFLKKFAEIVNEHAEMKKNEKNISKFRTWQNP